MDRSYFIPFLKYSFFGLFFLGIWPSSYAQIRAIKPFEKTRALVVGVSEYDNKKIPQLKYAHKDAEAFAHFLQNETAWKVAPEDLVLLTNEEATYGKFINELQYLKEKCQANDRLIIYFSGHGDVEVVSEEKTGYLLFHDVSPTTYASGGACMVNTLNDFLQELVSDNKTEVILITDACRSGTLAGSSIGGPTATTTALLELFVNTTKILSCEPHQVSLEGEWGGGRGLFSYHLVNGLKGMADQDGNRYVDLFEIERYVQDSVREDSEKEQLPQTKGLSSIKINKVDRQIARDLESTLPQEEPLAQQGRATQSDSNYLLQLAKFETALNKKHLLYPEEGSAYQIYSSMGSHPQAQAIKKVMKISLSTALQDEAQKALNEYITSPGKELAKRWSNASIYTYYPDYLGKAAEMLGQDNYFHNDIKSREHYFRGVNLRLESDKNKGSESLLKQALNEQQTALQLQPIAPHIYNELGLIHKRLDQKIQAISYFQQALTLSPRWSLALTNLAQTYLEMEQYPFAEKAFKDAINLDTTFALAHYNLSVLYEELAKDSLAIQELQKTVRFDTEFSNAYYNLAYLYIKNPSTYEEAEDVLLKYIQLNPSDPDGYSLLGHVYATLEQFEKARVTYESLILIDSSNYILSSLAFVYKQLGELNSSKQFYQKVTNRNPDDLKSQLYLARVHCLLKEYQESIDIMKILAEKEFLNYEQINEQADFEKLKPLKEYQAFIKEYFPDKQ